MAKENCVADFVEFLGPFSREEFSSMPGTYVDCSRKKKLVSNFVALDFDMILMNQQYLW